MMRKANITPIDVDGNLLSPIEINLDGIPSLCFVLIDGFVFMHADNLREGVKIAESMQELDVFYKREPMAFKVRSTAQIITEGNAEWKRKIN